MDLWRMVLTVFTASKIELERFTAVAQQGSTARHLVQSVNQSVFLVSRICILLGLLLAAAPEAADGVGVSMPLDRF